MTFLPILFFALCLIPLGMLIALMYREFFGSTYTDMSFEASDLSIANNQKQLHPQQYRRRPKPFVPLWKHREKCYKEYNQNKTK